MGLGMPEVILILVVALIIFGPRKLPELGKSLGNAMSQFRRASDDFKRTWEQEVEMDKYRSSTTESNAASSDYNSSNDYNSDYNSYSADSETANANAAQTTDNQSANSTASQEPAKAEALVAAAASNDPKQQHWI
jgi:sec-independent protein translocase protein TatA